MKEKGKFVGTIGQKAELVHTEYLNEIQYLQLIGALLKASLFSYFSDCQLTVEG